MLGQWNCGVRFLKPTAVLFLLQRHCCAWFLGATSSKLVVTTNHGTSLSMDCKYEPFCLTSPPSPREKESTAQATPKRRWLRQVWEKSEFVTKGPSKLAKQPNNHSKAPASLIDNLLRLRTKKGLQGGKTIQQRSEFFASLVPNAFTSSLAHALVRSLHTCMCVYYSESTQLCVAATLLVLPGAGTNESDRPVGLIVVTHYYD